MENFIPCEQLSEKEKRKIDQAGWLIWGELKSENSKAYNRKNTGTEAGIVHPVACDFS